MSHLTFAEAGIVGLLQGVTELFPVSSLGHSVLIPALVGGQWATDLNVSRTGSPYLAFVVGLHVATAIAMIVFFWRDWLRIIVAFCASVAQFISPAPGTRRFELRETDARLAWMIIIGTIPVGLAGVALNHLFTTVFSKPVLTAIFLFVNGLILLGGERLRRRGAGTGAEAEAAQAAEDRVTERQAAGVTDRQAAGVTDRQAAGVGGGSYGPPGGRHSTGQRAVRQAEANQAVAADRRLVALGYRSALALGACQILALLPGISRDGTVMVAGLFRGLTREDAARFSFLLSAPVIFAAGTFKLHDLTGPLGNGIRAEVLFGSVLSGIGAYLALRFLVRYLSDPARTLVPFAIYCMVAGLGSAIYLSVR